MQHTQLAIFLSPHLDDIPLSCGGVAARLSRAGARCVEVAVCTALPPSDGPLSPFTREMHDKWEQAGGQSGKSVMEVRREEERQAARLLGLEVVMLDLPDAVYRRGPSGEYLYDSDETRFGKVAR